MLKELLNSCNAIEYEGKTYKFTLSVGCAMYPEQGIVYHDLAKKAHRAMLNVKANGKNAIFWYKEESHD